MKIQLIYTIFILLICSTSYGQEIVSLYPSEASTGQPVTLIGGPFPEGTLIVVGDREIIPQRRGERQLIFSTPDLNPGEYPVFLMSGDERSEKTAVLIIIEPSPRILSISPTNIDQCVIDEAPIVTLDVADFVPGGSLLFDGKTIPFVLAEENRLTFTMPPLGAGTYGIQIINPGGTRSLPRSLWVNNIPEIFSASAGSDYVSFYEVVIEGKNFIFGSLLVVNEYQIGFSDLPPYQRVIAGVGREIADRAPLSTPDQTVRSDSVRYVDCRTLIYNRHPYSSQPKDLVLQVVNPDGKKSNALHVSLP